MKFEKYTRLDGTIMVDLILETMREKIAFRKLNGYLTSSVGEDYSLTSTNSNQDLERGLCEKLCFVVECRGERRKD